MNQTHGAAGRFKRCLAAILLTLPLVQIGMFLTGIAVPIGRFELWGKSRSERLAIAWPMGGQLEELASQFPLNARIYMVDPDDFFHRQTQYYFLPRRISITMTNTGWTQDLYRQWDDWPTVDWLVQHGFTHLLKLTFDGAEMQTTICTFRHGYAHWLKLTTTNGLGGWVEAPSMDTPPSILKEP
jgi:hypothetical protein